MPIDSSTRLCVVVGLGLIGGSLAAALRKTQYCQEVIGVVRRQETAEIAVQQGIVDRAVLSFEDIASELSHGDVVVIAVPTLSMLPILQCIQRVTSDAVTITDAASVKGSVVSAVKTAWQSDSMPPQFVPGHPIAGSEKSGVMAANPELYYQHRVILTPEQETDSAHARRVKLLWEAVGAEVLTMSVADHDAILAATSHLPHAIAYSLVDTLANDLENENIFRYAAGGFRDFTRIASSDPQMWHDIMLANREEVLSAIDVFQNNLHNMRQAIASQDSQYLLETFARAKQARDHFSCLLKNKSQ